MSLSSKWDFIGYVGNFPTETGFGWKMQLYQNHRVVFFMEMYMPALIQMEFSHQKIKVEKPKSQQPSSLAHLSSYGED